MRATYMPAEARCRQLARLIERNPGMTVEELAVVAGIAYPSARAYVRRLEREQRIDVVLDEPASSRGCRKWLFAKVAAAVKKAA
jgi:hypothetical protein